MNEWIDEGLRGQLPVWPVWSGSQVLMCCHLKNPLFYDYDCYGSGNCPCFSFLKPWLLSFAAFRCELVSSSGTTSGAACSLKRDHISPVLCADPPECTFLKQSTLCKSKAYNYLANTKVKRLGYSIQGCNLSSASFPFFSCSVFQLSDNLWMARVWAWSEVSVWEVWRRPTWIQGHFKLNYLEVETAAIIVAELRKLFSDIRQRQT